MMLAVNIRVAEREVRVVDVVRGPAIGPLGRYRLTRDAVRTKLLVLLGAPNEPEHQGRPVTGLRGGNPRVSLARPALARQELPIAVVHCFGGWAPSQRSVDVFLAY